MNPINKICLQIALISYYYLLGCTTTQQISYQNDVYPIFIDKCIRCHAPPYGEGYKMTGLDLSSHETLMDGSIYGSVIVRGNSTTSPLNILVEGRAGNLSRVLKNQHKPMTDREIKVLHLWVEQGARNN